MKSAYLRHRRGKVAKTFFGRVRLQCLGMRGLRRFNHEPREIRYSGMASPRPFRIRISEEKLCFFAFLVRTLLTDP